MTNSSMTNDSKTRTGDPVAVLQGVLGETRCSGDAATRAMYAVDGCRPQAVAWPRTAEEVGAVLAAANAHGWAVIPWGSGSALAEGDVPTRYDVALMTTDLGELLDEDADNLTVTVAAGMRAAELNRRLRDARLHLPLTLGEGQGTIGGALMADRPLPKRLLHGDLRDLLLGLRVALPDGSLVRYGRKVIKNVAGYDMNKLFLGSRGMLGVVVEATLRVTTLPDQEAWLVAGYASIRGAAQGAAALYGSALLPACLHILLGDAVVAFQGMPGADLPEGRALLVVGFEGRGVTVRRQLADANRLLLAADASAVAELETLPAALAAALDDPRHAAPHPVAALRLSVAPTAVAESVARAVGTLVLPNMSVGVAADYSAGVVRLVLSGEDDDMWERLGRRLAELRRGLADHGGLAMVSAAPTAFKALAPAWGELGGEGRLMQRIKQQFDPLDMLVPGRYVPAYRPQS
jgi:glycolate oxidase FAD binding subunit